MNRISLAIVVCLLFGLGGCGSGGGSPIRYYLIDPVDQAPLVAKQGMKIQVQDLHIPQYLERFQIATRTGTNQLVFSDSHQWGENLRKNLLRTTGRNLARLLGTADIGTPIGRSSAEPQFKVLIFIEQFDQGSDGHVVLAARYQISNAEGTRVLLTRSFDSVSSLNSKGRYATMVSEMQILLNELCIVIAQALDTRHE